MVQSCAQSGHGGKGVFGSWLRLERLSLATSSDRVVIDTHALSNAQAIADRIYDRLHGMHASAPAA
jgi:hypothetical protein